MNIFEQASKIKLRFDYHGVITVEDLWDLRVEALDEIYGKLRTEQRAVSTDSLLERTSGVPEDCDLAIGLIKHIIETKLTEVQVRKNLASIKLQREKIAGIIQEKSDEGLKSMTVEELKKALAELEV